MASFKDSILRVIVAMNDKVSLFGLTREDGKKEAQVFKVGNDIEDDIVNGDTVNNKWPPVVDWIFSEVEDDPLRFLLFWKKKLWLIEFLSNNWILKAPRELPMQVAWAKVLSNRLLCIINPGLEVEFLSVERVFADLNP